MLKKIYKKIPFLSHNLINILDKNIIYSY